MCEVYDTIFRESLKEFSVSDGGQISGYCNSSEELERLLDNLKCVGFCYCVRGSRRTSIYRTEHKTSYFFQHLCGNVHIPFFGPAFSVESTCMRHCTLGPKYYKEREPVVPDHLADHVIPRKKRLLAMPTRKSNCPATLGIKCVRVYPGYVIQSINVPWRTKGKVLDRLRKDMELPHKPDSYLRFYLVASPASLHTHSTENVEASGYIHPLLVKEIQNLVQNGTTSVKVIKVALDRFVNNHFTTANMPCRTNTTFYPLNRTIYSHVYRALHMIKSPIDQSTLQNQISLIEIGSHEETYVEHHIPETSDIDPIDQSTLQNQISLIEISSDEETYVEHHIPETSDSHSQQLEARKLCERVSNLTDNCNNSETLKKVLGLLRNCVQELEGVNA